jgi:hypothetical protein
MDKDRCWLQARQASYGLHSAMEAGLNQAADFNLCMRANGYTTVR